MSWKAFAESFASGAGSSLGGRLLGPWVDEFNAKALGIPSPNKPGAQELDAMDRMFPGTNPWERLGGGGGGQAAQATAHNTARRNADVQAGAQNYQTRTTREVAEVNKDIAEINADATKFAAMAGAGNPPSFGDHPGGPTDYQRNEMTFREAMGAANTLRANTDVRRLAEQSKLWSAQEKAAFAQALLSGSQADLNDALAFIERERGARVDDLIDAEISRSLSNLVVAADDFPAQVAGWLTAIGLGWVAKYIADYLKSPEHRERRNRARTAARNKRTWTRSNKIQRWILDFYARHGRRPTKQEEIKFTRRMSDGERNWLQRRWSSFRGRWRGWGR